MSMFKPSAHLRDWKAGCGKGKHVDAMTTLLQGVARRFDRYDRIALVESNEFGGPKGVERIDEQITEIETVRKQIESCVDKFARDWTAAERTLIEDKILDTYAAETAYWKDARRRLKMKKAGVLQAMDKVGRMGDKLEDGVAELQVLIDTLSNAYERLMVPATAKGPAAAALAQQYRDTAKIFEPKFKELVLKQESVRKAANVLMQMCPANEKEGRGVAILMDERANAVRKNLNLWGRIFAGYQRDLKAMKLA